uniref:Uncharacterized protein n=1 Tax=Arundo donax TaxID=35708 RepID=A0A0A9BXM5_ARUDO
MYNFGITTSEVSSSNKTNRQCKYLRTDFFSHAMLAVLLFILGT